MFLYITTLQHSLHYLCKLLTYGHQICTAGATGMNAPTDRFTSSLTYFNQSINQYIYNAP